jgi:hypothetical protein
MLSAPASTGFELRHQTFEAKRLSRLPQLDRRHAALQNESHDIA